MHFFRSSGMFSPRLLNQAVTIFTVPADYLIRDPSRDHYVYPYILLIFTPDFSWYNLLSAPVLNLKFLRRWRWKCCCCLTKLRLYVDRCSTDYESYLSYVMQTPGQLLADRSACTRAFCRFGPRLYSSVAFHVSICLGRFNEQLQRFNCIGYRELR